MAWEVYGGKSAPESGLGASYCLRDSVTGQCKRDWQGHLQTFPDADTAKAAIPLAVKEAKAAEVIAAPVKAIPQDKAK